jgi:DNA-binding YbaB/EbfC family protein
MDLLKAILKETNNFHFKLRPKGETMGTFDKAKQLYDLQKKARAIQKELKDTEVEAKAAGGAVTVVFNGEQHIQSVEIGEEMLAPEKKRDLERALQQAISEAVSRVQAVGAEKMKAIAGNLNIPGM